MKFAVFTGDDSNPIAVNPAYVTCVTTDPGDEDEDGIPIDPPQPWTLIHFTDEEFVSVANEFTEVVAKLEEVSRIASKLPGALN